MNKQDVSRDMGTLPGRKIVVPGAAALPQARKPGAHRRRLYTAKTTPHMFIVNPAGALIYHGAIDSEATTDQAIL
jgi:hypothetical protein